MGILSFYILLNILLLVGILKKIGWILITWMTFTILHVGLAFLTIHVYFYVHWITILMCIGLVISATISVLIVEEYCWTIKSGSSTSNSMPLEALRNWGIKIQHWIRFYWPIENHYVFNKKKMCNWIIYRCCFPIFLPCNDMKVAWYSRNCSAIIKTLVQQSDNTNMF